MGTRKGICEKFHKRPRGRSIFALERAQPVRDRRCAAFMSADFFPIHTPEVARLAVSADALVIGIRGDEGRAVFVALDTDPLRGSAVLPFGKDAEGSTVFLPIRADRFFVARRGAVTMRTHRGTMWGNAVDAGKCDGRISIPLSALGAARRIRVVIFEKDMSANDGWGRMIADARFGAKDGEGDQYVSRFEEVDLTRFGEVAPSEKSRGERTRIYQLLPRLFGNVNETRKPYGALAENGVGKFADINDAACGSLAAMGFTHVWLTGILQQATGTDYSAIGEPADDPALLKGRAGSPYAIRDCFDLCPDYAVRPADRLAEFHALLARLHAAGLRVLMDFVPNHVARSYRSSVMPDLSFGAQDDRSRFFDANNNFFWLQRDSPGGGPPLRLPPHGVPFAEEREHGRVTGNNAATWQPSPHDWYETVKLNYGFDFTTGARAYPHGDQESWPIPDTWLKMDRVLAYWQEQGVDGFRCDMAHMVPPEFWAWAISHARVRKPDVIFIGEAYDNDPMKVPGGDPLHAALNDRRGNVMFDLLAAGFDAVYDDPSYKKLKAIYDGSGWANDLDHALGPDFVFQNSLRYAENHDEVRLAGDGQWGGIGAEVGRVVSAILFALSRGPVLLYSGQEIGEPARGAEGFGGDDARTTIFDYWSMPEFVKWVNDHRYDGARLSPEQRELRDFYARLLRLVGEPAFRDGEFIALNPANIHNEHFGRLPGEPASGHWLYAFLRSDAASGQRFLVVANLHPTQSFHRVGIRLPANTFPIRGQCIERLTSGGTLRIVSEEPAGLTIDTIPALTPFVFECLPSSVLP